MARVAVCLALIAPAAGLVAPAAPAASTALKAEAAASKLLKRHWKAGDVGTTSAGFSEVKAPPPPEKFHPPEVEINRGIYGFDVPEPPPVSEAELAAAP